MRATTRTGYIFFCHMIGLRKPRTLLRPQKNGGGRVESCSKENHDTMESLRSIDISTLELAENSIEKSFFLFFFTGIT